MLDVSATLEALSAHLEAEHARHAEAVRAEAAQHAEAVRAIEADRELALAARDARARADAAEAVVLAALARRGGLVLGRVVAAAVGGVSAQPMEAASTPSEPASAPAPVKAAKGPPKPTKKVPSKKLTLLEYQLVDIMRAAEGPVTPLELLKDLAGRGRDLKESTVRTTLSHSELFVPAGGRKGWVLSPKAKQVEIPEDLWPTPVAKPIALRMLNGSGEAHEPSVGV